MHKCCRSKSFGLKTVTFSQFLNFLGPSCLFQWKLSLALGTVKKENMLLCGIEKKHINHLMGGSFSGHVLFSGWMCFITAGCWEFFLDYGLSSQNSTFPALERTSMIQYKCRSVLLNSLVCVLKVKSWWHFHFDQFWNIQPKRFDPAKIC